jgi:hypothetical protein
VHQDFSEYRLPGFHFGILPAGIEERKTSSPDPVLEAAFRTGFCANGVARAFIHLGNQVFHLAFRPGRWYCPRQTKMGCCTVHLFDL